MTYSNQPHFGSSMAKNFRITNESNNFAIRVLWIALQTTWTIFSQIKLDWKLNSMTLPTAFHLLNESGVHRSRVKLPWSSTFNLQDSCYLLQKAETVFIKCSQSDLRFASNVWKWHNLQQEIKSLNTTLLMGCGGMAFGEGGEWNTSVSLIHTNLLQNVSLWKIGLHQHTHTHTLSQDWNPTVEAVHRWHR